MKTLKIIDNFIGNGLSISSIGYTETKGFQSISSIDFIIQSVRQYISCI